MCWHDGSGGAGGNQRRQRLAQDFLAWMDQTGDLLSLAERQEVDPIKQERMEVRGHHAALQPVLNCEPYILCCSTVSLYATLYMYDG